MVVLSVCIDCGLYIVGSSLNGFGTSQSDMDLCLMVSHLEVLLSPLSEVILSLSPILLAARGIVSLTCPLVSACVLLACMHAYVCVCQQRSLSLTSRWLWNCMQNYSSCDLVVSPLIKFQIWNMQQFHLAVRKIWLIFRLAKFLRELRSTAEMPLAF